jgi:hypothetical protein
MRQGFIRLDAFPYDKTHKGIKQKKQEPRVKQKKARAKLSPETEFFKG